jgi:hypothetical protein
MCERREIAGQLLRWVIIGVFVVFAIPTLIGVLMIRHQQAVAHRGFTPAGSRATPAVKPAVKTAVKDTSHGM